MRISDWSSDVCSSDLEARLADLRAMRAAEAVGGDFGGVPARRLGTGTGRKIGARRAQLWRRHFTHHSLSLQRARAALGPRGPAPRLGMPRPVSMTIARRAPYPSRRTDGLDRKSTRLNPSH